MAKHTWQSGEIITATLLNDLEERASKIPEKGETGPKGDKGDIGPQGPKGKDSEVTKEAFDALVARVSVLENQKQ
ncbi:hypothetical protein ACFJYA_07975 [Enterococcus faecalis]